MIKHMLKLFPNHTPPIPLVILIDRISEIDDPTDPVYTGGDMRARIHHTNPSHTPRVRCRLVTSIAPQRLKQFVAHAS